VAQELVVRVSLDVADEAEFVRLSQRLLDLLNKRAVVQRFSGSFNGSLKGMLVTLGSVDVSQSLQLSDTLRSVPNVMHVNMEHRHARLF
jgi:hypothetical protein